MERHAVGVGATAPPTAQPTVGGAGEDEVEAVAGGDAGAALALATTPKSVVLEFEAQMREAHGFCSQILWHASNGAGVNDAESRPWLLLLTRPDVEGAGGDAGNGD
eukprot:SAG11_NODE_4183_length_2024_cov_2.920519_1_plen_106_part_00